MKRSAPSTKALPKAKKLRPEVPEYHLAPSLKDEDGNIIWPAPKSQIDNARRFIQECAKSNKPTLIVPDKDADGLTSGAILRTTLRLLGLPEELIEIHLLSKGTTVHDESERTAMAAHSPAYIFILDHGSRQSPPAIDPPHKCLVIDHHHIPDSSSFPKGAEFVNACNCPPVPTTSLLTYLICETLHPDVPYLCDWLAVIGTYGDLSSTIKWSPPFPDMSGTLKKYTKKALNDCVSLLNGPRRTNLYDTITAWTALLAAADQNKILGNKRLIQARQDIHVEVERCTHVAPKFSRDATIAVLRIRSAFQVHPVIATRWAGTLSSKKLQVVLVANEGYILGKVNFSCRIPRCARARAAEEGGEEVNIINVLKEAAGRGGDLLERMGDSFARGHKEASGGIVGAEEFEELMGVLGVGEKPDGPGSKSDSPKKAKAAGQKNTLMNYFGAKTGGGI
ncbi:DHH phosphoesterase [Rhizodiscina lignyota]|uniref:DHH phosphoesterase n=1 Tax=Rhizodiscina lignyota TaxID=1504668 RepID=A0A9P4M3X2_9PEZI|nr:DHH phosphoesterase [Rhizodiscina lignyota]